MPTIRDQIIQKTIELLKGDPRGLRFSEIVRRVKGMIPDVNLNTVNGSIWDIDIQKPNEVYKVDRGLFRHVSFRGKEEVITQTIHSEVSGIKEKDFYNSFSDYLVGELGDCTKAISLGGNRFKDKWGTPDVIGKNEPGRSDIIKHETEIISAEIKIDDFGLITAFGQACAYKSFSHKVYIVIPKSASDEDKARIESLSLIFGIGLILFDATNKENPQFEIRVRPTKHEPDSFYVNKYMKLIEDELFR